MAVEFHAAGPACEKERSPNLVRSRGVMYLLLEADRRPVRVEKDLTVLITSDLKAGEQCMAVYGKANRMLGLIKRMWVDKDRKALLALYQSIVRPHLEYSCSAWTPHCVNDREVLEKIQHRFTRLFKDLQDVDYLQRLDCLGLCTIKERRNRSDLI